MENNTEKKDNLDLIEQDKSSWGGKREGSGRKPGTPNKITRKTKEDVLEVFDNLGGVAHMTQWAAENPNQFYTIWAKLLPTQSELGTMEGQDSPLNVTLKFIKPDDSDRD